MRPRPTELLARIRATQLPAILRAQLRRDPWLVALFALLWGVSLVPLWRPRFLPLLDLPNHLDAIALWHRYGDPSWGYQKFYTLNLKPVPYWGYFFPVHLLSYLLPIEAANKVYLSAYALALPLGASLLARQMRRSPWLGLLTFPLVFNMNFSLGFITFCAGVAVLLFALVALERFLEGPTRRNGVALFLLSLGLYSTHVLPWLYFGVAAAILLCCHGLKPRRILTAAALMLPSVLVGAYGFRRAADGTTHVRPGPIELKASFEEPLAILQQSPLRVLATWPGQQVFLLLIALAAIWFALLSSPRPEQPAASSGPDAARPGFRYRLELLFALACAAALWLPIHQFKPVDLWMIGGRFVTVAAVLGALLPRGPITGARRLLFVPLVLLAAWYPLRLSSQWRAFDRRAKSFARLMRHVPRGSSTLTLVRGEGADPAVDGQALPYLQFHAYAQYLGGGFDPWALNTGFPMIPRPEMVLPSPMWKHVTTFQFERHGIYYDFIITKGEGRDHELFGPDDAGRAPLIAADGRWRLYQVRNPEPPPGPQPQLPEYQPRPPEDY